MSHASRTRETKTLGSARPASNSSNQICTVRIELRGTDPLIWRQVEVPTSITLEVLHEVIQIAMGWLDRHFWEFKIGKQRYGLPMDDDWGAVPCIEATNVCLRDVLKPCKTMIDYLYDFGDDWAHRLTVTGRDTTQLLDLDNPRGAFVAAATPAPKPAAAPAAVPAAGSGSSATPAPKETVAANAK